MAIGVTNTVAAAFDITSVNSPVINENKDRGIQLQLRANLGAAELTSITAFRSFNDFQDNDVDFSGADLLRQEIDFGIETFTQELRLTGQAFDGRLDWLVGGFYSDESIEYGESIGLGAQLDPYATILSAGLAGLYSFLRDFDTLEQVQATFRFPAVSFQGNH